MLLVRWATVVAEKRFLVAHLLFAAGIHGGGNLHFTKREVNIYSVPAAGMRMMATIYSHEFSIWSVCSFITDQLHKIRVLFLSLHTLVLSSFYASY
jgi:hypothetical protein